MHSFKTVFSNNTSLMQSRNMSCDSSNAKILIPKSKWISDEKATSCFNCNSDFIFLIKRRHHCRMCGQVFCSKCSNYFLEPGLIGINHEEKSIRFCEYCYKIVARIIGLNSKSEVKENNPNFDDSLEMGISQNIFRHYHENNDLILSEGNLMNSVGSKIEKITEYLFKRYNLYDKYYKILVEKIKRASTEIIINTLVLEDPMNINEYVKIKKILHSNEAECKFICGVVCNKNISHRKMKGNLKDPKILLISPSLEIPHCKRESLTYFEDLKENEEKFIKQSIANIIKINPNIVLVEQSINGRIQKYLYEHEILYVQKIKPKLLKRIARTTQGQIIEDVIKMNKTKIESSLGKCRNFYVRTFHEGESKLEQKGQDLMYIDGCKEGYGTTITISGPDANELTVLKKCMKYILVLARHLNLEKELVNLDRSFEVYKFHNKQPNNQEINSQGDFRSFIDEKIPLKELIDCTKISCMKINLVEVPAEYFHDLASLNERFIENIHTFIQSNKSRLKVPFLAVMCGNPLQKCHEFYSDEGGGEENPQDTTLGNYIKLRVNNLFTRCSSCKRPRYRHVIVYYHRNTYLKVTAELIGVTKALALRKEEDTMRQNNSLILDKTPKYKSLTEFEWKNHESSSKTSQNNINDGTFTSFTGDIPSNKSQVNGNNMNKMPAGSTPKVSGSSAEKDSSHPFNNFGTRIASIFSKNTTHNQATQEEENTEIKGKSSFRESNKRTIIQTYIECQNCNEKLTTIRDLQILYLEYSFSEFLRHFFINSFQKNFDIEENEKIFEKNECPHHQKCRVFKLDEFLVKFFGGYNKLFSIKPVDYLEEGILAELKARDEKICQEKTFELKEKIIILIKFLRLQIGEKKAIIRKPRLRSSVLNTQSFNPDNLTSPLKKKDLITLINELNGVYKSLDMHYDDLMNKLSKITNYLEVEKNRIRCFSFFLGILQKLSYLENLLPKEVKEEEDPIRTTLNNFKKIFTFGENFSPSFKEEKPPKVMKNILSEELSKNNEIDDIIMKADVFISVGSKLSSFRYSKTSKYYKNEPITSTLITYQPNKCVHHKSKSCPNVILDKHKFTLFLSEEDIKIPQKILISMLKENNQFEDKVMPFTTASLDKNRRVKTLRFDGTSKAQSEEHAKMQNELSKSIKSNSDKKENLHIPLEEMEEENDREHEILKTKENSPENKDFNEIDIMKHNNKINNSSDNNDKKSIPSDQGDDVDGKNSNKLDEHQTEEEEEEVEVYQHFNPNNLLKSKKFRKRSSTSLGQLETQEWMILLDLLKGFCDPEPENEFKTTKFYKFVPIIRTQPLSVIAYALNSTKYLKEVYIKEGFYEQQKFLKKIQPSQLAEHLTNFIKMKLYFNECVEKNDEFMVQTNILEVKKGKFAYRNSYHNLEKLQQEEENRLKFRKNTSYISSFDENEDVMSYLVPSNKVKILIYYPRQFEALRMSQNILLSDFIKSLALSNPWSDNTGGKSNASFIKTYDNLYVFKNLKNNEFKMFKAYAIEFFKYMFETSFEEKKKSFIAKIYGMFEVHIDSEKYYYIAMENLLFGLDATSNLKIYDLKGSETNRYIANSKANQVLFDTNFKIDQNGEPLSLNYQDKDFLSEAIENDTEFLSKHNLIDYSLLLIIDNKNALIRMGIIDYLRLYTWDKNLESIGKKMIKAGATPTIINAIDYRKRFQEAMNKYFMGVHH